MAAKRKASELDTEYGEENEVQQSKRQRKTSDLDPEYEDITTQQTLRQRRLEEDAKEATSRKIESIIRSQFSQQIHSKEAEIDLIDRRLQHARRCLDRLRACIVASFYTNAGQTHSFSRPVGRERNEPPSIHPVVKKYLGKTVPHTRSGSSKEQSGNINGTISGEKNASAPEGASSRHTQEEAKKSEEHKKTDSKLDQSHKAGNSRFKVKKRIVVGHVSKYIPVDKREGSDQSTHKWMVYVRGSKDEPHIDHFVKKVWFYLHPSYRPNDLVEISAPPFHLTRRGWGEFPIRVQLFFKDARNKKIDIIHHLKLDRTYTGLQTLGGETNVDVELERESLEPKTKASQPMMKKSASMTTLEGNVTRAFSGILDTTPTAKESRHKHKSATPGKKKNGPSAASRDISMTSDEDSRASFSSAGTSEMSSNISMTPSSGLVTPTKGKGWMHLQIKSEPSSPIPRVITATPPAGRRDSILTEDSDSNISVEKAVLTGPGSLSGRSDSMTPMSVKIEPMSPDRASLNRTPVTFIGDTGSMSITPAATPTKNNVSSPGWTHVQIKSEPTSPIQGVAGGPGWQRLTHLTTPPKHSGAVSPASSTKSCMSSPVGIKPVSLQIGSIGSKTGNSASSSPATTPETPQEEPSKTAITNLSGATANTEGAQSRTLLMGSQSFPGQIQISQPLTSPFRVNQPGSSTEVRKSGAGLVRTPGGGMLLIQQQTPPGVQIQASPRGPALVAPTGMPAPKPGQPTVYVKCVDNQGKIYLIPQHLLTKVPNATTSPGGGISRQLLPGQVVISQQSLLSTQKASPRVATPQTLLQTSPAPGAIIRMPAPPGVTTGSSPQLILQGSAGGSSKVAVPVGSNVVLQMASPSGVAGQLVSPPGFRIGQPVSKTLPTGALSQLRQVTPPSKAGSKPETNPGVTQLLQISPTDVKNIKLEGRNTTPFVSPLQSPVKALGQGSTDNFVILGGNLMAAQNKPAMVVVSQDSGRPVSMATQPARTGAVSLLSGKVSGMPPANKVAMSQGTVSSSGTTITGQKSVLTSSSTSGSNISQAGKQQVILLQQGTASKSQSLLTSSTAKATAAKPQSLLTSASKSAVTVKGQGQGQVGAGQSLLTTATIGNQTVILQLLPEQQAAAKAAAANQNTASATLTSAISGAAKQKLISTLRTSQTPVSSQNVGSSSRPPSVKSLTGSWSSRPRPLGTCDTLRQKKQVKKERIFNLADYDSMVDLVNAVLVDYPLVQADADRSQLPFCAVSQEQFLSWNVGKRRAAEWQRACSVLRKVRILLSDKDSFHGDEVWNTKQMMIWCRANSYTPLDTECTRHLTRAVRPLQSSGIQVNSYTDGSPIWRELLENEDNNKGHHQENIDDDIDIISVEPANKEKVVVKQETPNKEEGRKEYLESPLGVDFVQETAAQIGVRLRPTEVDPEESAGIYSSTVEQMILSCMKSFVGDIMRKATSVIFHDNRIPEEISTADIHKSVMSLDRCDFLSNKYLGVPMESGSPES